MRRRSYPAVLVVVAASLACDNAIDPDSTIGALSVELTGALNRVFDVEGVFQGDTIETIFASARRFSTTTSSGINIVGAHLNGDMRDAVDLFLTDYHGTGTYALVGGLHFPSSAESRALFRIVSGELILTYASEVRLRGTFSAIAVNLIMGREPGTDTVRLSNGRFDVPLEGN